MSNPLYVRPPVAGLGRGDYSHRHGEEADRREAGRRAGPHRPHFRREAVGADRHAGHLLRRLPGTAPQAPRRLRGPDLHRPAVQLQPQLRGLLGREKRAFEDRHASTQAYIDYMRPRCVELARVLKTTGSFYYHCDWHASHYVKVMLDRILGENNFQSEIIWRRTNAKGPRFQVFWV